jgi:LysR family transcriptional regulator, glycine cleavage system transcriptional activator
MTFLLPPLNALRSFEAAARHRSFQRAAGELHVTAGAVGQQVRAFEDLLGVELFKRVHNRLVLTDIGRSYARAACDAFERLSTATAALGVAHPAVVICLGVRTGLPLKGPQGLLSLIDEFRRTVGVALLLTVRVYQPAGLAELIEGKIDVAIVGGADHPEGFRCDFLAGIAWGKGDNFLVVPDGTADCQEITALREWLLKLTTEPLAKRAGVGRSV